MPEAYTGSLDIPNDYRCFVLDPASPSPPTSPATRSRPDQREEIHHAQVFHIDAGQAADGDATARASDGQPGLELLRRRRRGTDHPGTEPPGSRRPAGRLHRPGRPHRRVGAGPGPGRLPRQLRHPLRARRRPRAADPLPLRGRQPDARPVAPSPCRPSPGTDAHQAHRDREPARPRWRSRACPAIAAPLCDRDAALADNARLYGPSGALIEAGPAAALSARPPQS